MSATNKKRIIIGITGASGSVYAKSLLQSLEKLKDHYEEVAIIFSDNGLAVWKYELGKSPVIPKGFTNYKPQDLFASPASGSAGYTNMVICPCSMGTLARVANGISTDLITRAADVMLKERRQLILVPREMPYSLIHIRNMETITLAGGIICPASPSYYFIPKTMDEIVNTVTEKILSLMGFETNHLKWGSKS
jgi:flavin prenyltransferase